MTLLSAPPLPLISWLLHLLSTFAASHTSVCTIYMPSEQHNNSCHQYVCVCYKPTTIRTTAAASATATIGTAITAAAVYCCCV